MADALRDAAVLLQDRQRRVHVGGIDDIAEADAHVEDSYISPSSTFARRWIRPKIGCGSMKRSITKPTAAETRVRFRRPSLVMLISASTPATVSMISSASGT